MIVRNRKRQNPTVLCDVVGCGISEPLNVPVVTPNGFNSYAYQTNPKLKAWRSLGTFAVAQLHFCTEHAGVLLDVVFSHVEIAAGAADAMRALSVVTPFHVDEKVES